LKNQTTFIGNKFWLILNLGSFLFLLNAVSCSDDPINPEPVPRSLQVWVHHVNSIERAQHFQNIYSGLELDVHYDTTVGTFIVKHDYADTTTLTFSTWLSSITNPGRLGFWLDFKNLASWNKTAALAELLRIRGQFDLTHNPVIVESSSPECLPRFDTLNFRVSFYIPTFNPETITKEEELAYRDFIEEGILSYDIGTISAYSFQHGFMRQWFPDMNKLLWCLDVTDPALKDSVISEIRKDPTVEVLLLSDIYPLSYHSVHTLFYNKIEK
jgi:hypothetical protein